MQGKPGQEEGIVAQALENQPLEEIEKAVVLQTLEACGGNKSETARRLGVSRKTLHKKLKKYGRM